MDAVLTFIRDKIVGIPYIILVVISLFLIFAIIGYLVSLKYRENNDIQDIDADLKIDNVENVNENSYINNNQVVNTDIVNNNIPIINPNLENNNSVNTNLDINNQQ